MLTTLEPHLTDFTGTVITPDLPEYAAAARTALVEAAPDIVLRPRDITDVQRAVRAAAASELPLAVRGGGHSFAGLGTVDGGIVIDLGSLDSVEVLDGGRVVLGGGATWGGVAEALAPHGLAISSGDSASVGVGGLTLSGGIGWMVRSRGLALDSLVSAQLVTADGETLTASRDQHPDLFWALRGGGGGFGIVVAFEFQAQQLEAMTFGTIAYPAAETAQVIAGWAAHMRQAPRTLASTVRIADPFAGGVDAPIVITVAATDEFAEAAIAPLRELGTVSSDDVRRRPYLDALEPGMTLPSGLRLTVRSGFVPAARVDAALAEVAAVASAPQPATIALHSLGGAVCDVGDDETAFTHRRAELLVTTFAGGPAAAFAGVRSGVDAVWSRLAPHTDGAYANFLDDSSPDAVASIHPEATLRALARIKSTYDPESLFSRTPASAAIANLGADEGER